MSFSWLRRTFYGFVGGAFFVLALFLIVVDVYWTSGKAINWSVIRQKLHFLEEPDRIIPPDEVQNFVLFSEVDHGSGNVVTGTEYSSTHDQSINKQWCYVSGSGSAGNTIPRLSLAGIDENGVKTIPKFSSAALRQFNLTQTSVKALIKSHCRFK